MNIESNIDDDLHKCFISISNTNTEEDSESKASKSNLLENESDCSLQQNNMKNPNLLYKKESNTTRFICKFFN